MTPLEQAKERMADPTLFPQAKARLETITSRLTKLKINEMALALQDEPTISGKVVWMEVMTNTLARATSGVSPCKDGCSHCCKMALNITVEEATRISKVSGIPMQTPDFSKPDNVSLFEGVPCPFLKDDRCSVYAVRPMPCKIHYSVDRDNLLCRIIPGEAIRAPTMDTTKFMILNALTYENPLDVKLADIREFFPKEDDDKP